MTVTSDRGERSFESKAKYRPGGPPPTQVIFMSEPPPRGRDERSKSPFGPMEFTRSSLAVIDGAFPHLLPDGPARRRDPPSRLPERLHLGGAVQVVAPRGLVAAA